MTDADFEDEGRIRALIGRAAYLGDHGEAAQYAEIYSHDAVWEMGDERQVGVGTIISSATERRANGIGGPGSNTKHIVTPMDVRFTSVDEAVATSYLTFWTNTDSTPTVALITTYTDTVRRDPEGWRISYRSINRG